MQARTIFSRGPWLLLPALLLGVTAMSTSAPVVGQEAPPPPPQGQEPQVLTRGPIHEGFAEPVSFNPKPGLTAPKEPPAAVEEVPPDEKPAGDNVAWLGGYWSWDEDRKDYIWVSGFWRVLPPNRKWIPGYWNRLDTGWQWTAGYWASAQQPDVEYLPSPPETLEQGPATEAPTTDHIWVPGCWMYRSRYLWRPGYWVVSQPGWVWYPSHYVYSPTGYIYVDGYWDYAFARRGVLFAPVYYDPWWHRSSVYVYRPSIVLDIGLVSAHFFCRPTYSHYYFGDYYASSYVSLGYTPWFSFHYSRGYYCPHYAYSRWYYRSTPGWEANLRVDFTYRRDHIAARPPRTYITQQNIVNNVTVINNKTVINNNQSNIDAKYRNQMAMAQPLSAAAKKSRDTKDAPLKFEKVQPQQVAQFKQQAQSVRAAKIEREKSEHEAMSRLPKSGTGGAGPAAPFKLSSPKSSIAAKPLPDTVGGIKSGPPTGGGTTGNRPPTGRPGGDSQPGSGGGKPPVVGSGGDSKRPGGNPPITGSGTGSGGNKPPMSGGAGGGSGKPPVVPPPGGGGKPPVVPPAGGGSKPPAVPPGGGGNKPPTMGSGGGSGGGRPPVVPPKMGGDRGGYTPPPSSGGGKYNPPPSGGGNKNTGGGPPKGNQSGKDKR